MGADAVAAPRRNELPAAMLRMASDQRLVAEMHAGSDRAFEVLFNRHHRPLLAFCRHMLGSQEEAEDAVQQTFLAVYGAIARGEQPRSLRPWLYTIARHRCLSELRGRRRRRLDDAPEPGADSLLSEVTTREELRAILADVARLPDDQRDALVLAQLGDVSHEEIARVVGCAPEKVKALVFQARSSLTAGRAAREISCAEIQEQLATLRGGALRRRVLRRHVHDCPGCRAFRDEMRARRRRLVLLLPAGPMGLKRTLLGGLFGSGGGGTAGACMTAGALGGAGLAVTALVAVAVPGGPFTRPAAPSGDDRAPARPIALARTASPSGAPAGAWSPRVGGARTAPARDREGWGAHAGDAAPLRERSADASANAEDVRPAGSEQPGAPEQPARTGSADQPDMTAGADPPGPTPARRTAVPAKPERPVKPEQLRPPRRAGPTGPPKPDHRLTPAAPPKATGPLNSGNPPTAPGPVAPARPDAQQPTPPVTPAQSAPATGHHGPPSTGVADPPGAREASGHGDGRHGRPRG